VINPNLADKVNWIGSMELDPLNINGELDCNVSFIGWWIERKRQAEENKSIQVLNQFLMSKSGYFYAAASFKINEASEIYIATLIPTTFKFFCNIKFKIEHYINATFGQSVYELAKKIYIVFIGRTYQAPPQTLLFYRIFPEN
jgi:hypothetical protein